MSLELSSEEVTRLIDEISLGGKIVVVQSGAGEDVPVLIKHCSNSDRVYAEFIYKSTYDKAIKEGFLTITETVDIIRDRGLLSADDDNKIIDLQKKIEAQKKVLERTTRVPARRDRLKEIIRSLEKQISEILYKRELFLDNTAERRAQEEKFLFLLWKGSYNPETKEYWWKTKEEFHGEKDLYFRKELFFRYLAFCHGLSMSLLRYIARNPLWRLRYTSSTKTGSTLFDKPISEYSVDQLSLVYWSNYYDSIYQMMPDEIPPDDIIDDDEALDVFMENYMEERKREAVASREKKGKVGSAWDKDEVIVTKSHESFSDIKYNYRKRAKEDEGKTNIVDKGTKLG